jgi:hypothetical protein
MHIDQLALESEKGAKHLPLRLERGESDATLAHRMGEGLGVREFGEVSKSFPGTILPGCLTLNSPTAMNCSDSARHKSMSASS